LPQRTSPRQIQDLRVNVQPKFAHEFLLCHAEPRDTKRQRRRRLWREAAPPSAWCPIQAFCRLERERFSTPPSPAVFTRGAGTHSSFARRYAVTPYGRMNSVRRISPGRMADGFGIASPPSGRSIMARAGRMAVDPGARPARLIDHKMRPAAPPEAIPTGKFPGPRTLFSSARVSVGLLGGKSGALLLFPAR